jgi:hypothetical protein
MKILFPTVYYCTAGIVVSSTVSHSWKCLVLQLGTSRQHKYIVPTKYQEVIEDEVTSRLHKKALKIMLDGRNTFSIISQTFSEVSFLCGVILWKKHNNVWTPIYLHLYILPMSNSNYHPLSDYVLSLLSAKFFCASWSVPDSTTFATIDKCIVPNCMWLLIYVMSLTVCDKSFLSRPQLFGTGGMSSTVCAFNNLRRRRYSMFFPDCRQQLLNCMSPTVWDCCLTSRPQLCTAADNVLSLDVFDSW